MTPESDPRTKKPNAPVLDDDSQSLNGVERGRVQRAAPRPKTVGNPQTDPPVAAASEERQRVVPQEIRERFISVGPKYYFPDGAQAFTDHGSKLTTRSENTEVIRSLIGIAQAREWSEITVTGTGRFRKEAWFAGRVAGIEVRGYAPTEFEQERLVRAIARREAGASAPELGADASRSRPPATRTSTSTVGERGTRDPEEQGPIAGRLVDHGRANYRHDPKEPMAYYARIETERGDREIWAVDLERAFRESLSRPTIGDEVTARAYGRDSVRVKALSEDGRAVGQQEITTHRNRWIVERNDFLAVRAAAAEVFRDSTVTASEAVKEHPMLQGSYLQLQAAKLGAERDIRDPEDQARFVAQARTALAEAIERGEPLQPVRIRERPGRAQEPEKSLNPEHTPTR